MQSNRFTSEPSEYLFSEEDIKKFSERYYRLPCRIVTDRSWARLWREFGKRGGGTMASVLPVLALSSYPDAPNIAGSDLPAPDEGFTPWAYLPVRRIGKLAGIDKDTAQRAMRSLERLGWAQLRTVACRDSAGGRKVWYRLSRKLFPAAGEPYAMIPGQLIYSGTWMMLPTSKARHLYLALAALDPIYDEEKLKAAFDSEHGIGDDEEQDDKVRKLREKGAVSWSSLIGLTGLCRSSLDEALAILITPLFNKNSIPLIRCGGKQRTPRWYRVEKDAFGWHWTVDFLNSDPKALDVHRRQLWPVIAQRLDTQKKQAGRRRFRGTRHGPAGSLVGT